MSEPITIRFTVELEHGVWIAPWDGDPGLTLRRENAKKFLSEGAANRALVHARSFRPFANAKVAPLP